MHPNSIPRTPPGPSHSHGIGRDPSRDAILASASRGWSPLQIKRSESPIKPTNLNPLDIQTSTGPRRTSNSFKHVKHNSLVSNSPFKVPGGGATAAMTSGGRPLSLDSGERKVSGTMKTVGLGISASPSKPRPLSREILDERRGGMAMPNNKQQESPVRPARPSQRHSSGSYNGIETGSTLQSVPSQPQPVDQSRPQPFPSTHHNNNNINNSAINKESPDVQSSDQRYPRQSMGLKGLARGALVTSSPFLTSDRSPEKAGPSESPTKNRGTTGGRGGGMMMDDERRLEVTSPMRATTGVGASRSIYASPSQPSRPDVFSSPAEIRSVPSNRHQADFGPPTSYTSTAQLEAELEEACAPIRSLPPLTPTRSSITSRRLRGPRLTGSDSPTIARQMKTVTFQAVPNVREFDIESMTDGGEGNSSVEYERGGDDDEEEDGEEREQEDEEGDSMEAISLESREGGRFTYYEREEYREERGASANPYLGVPRDLDGVNDQETSPMIVPEESMTANFIDSLVEDGYFSPPQLSEAHMAPALDNDSSPAGNQDIQVDFAPQLSTPSLGGSMSMTPVINDSGASDLGHGKTTFENVDEHGIPYGRTHHLERSVHAHSQSIYQAPPVPQPALPTQGRHAGQPDLRNADAAQPSTGLQSRYQGHGPQATQSGALVDPFITLETVTKVYHEEETIYSDPAPQREEDGIPLGRSSHNERAKVARLMATQSLGLGMPRRPAHPGTMGPPAPPTRQFSGESEDGSEVPDSDSEDEPEFAEKRSSFQPQPVVVQVEPELPSDKAQQRISMEKRSLPQPPRLEQVRAASPIVAIQAPMETPTETLVERSMYSLSLPFTLPGLSPTSPLLSSPFFEKDAKSNKTEATSTAPPTDDHKLAPTAINTAPPTLGFSNSQIGFRTTSEAFRMVEAALPPPSPTKAAESTMLQAPKVRQRISKDMIRQRMEEKKLQEDKAGVAEAAPRVTSVPLSIDKDLPIIPSTPSEAAWMASAFDKATKQAEEASIARPSLAPRSQSRSAEDVLRKAAEDGMMHAPKSALDRLVADLHPDGDAAVTPATGLADSPGIESRTKLSAAPQRDVGPETPGKTRGGSRRIQRRSVSNDDMRAERKPTQRMSMLDMHVGQDALGGPSMMASLQAELENIASDRPYRIHEQQQTVYASAAGKIQTTEAGDTDSGKAWRQLRKPSDMNQYAKELKALKAKQAGMAKATGTVFVKVMGIESLALPIPEQPTSFCITLDNGIDYIRTPYSRLTEGAKVNQEFALVEHANFEFTLGLEVRRDPHIVQMLHGNMQKTIAPSDTASMASTSRSAGGFRNIFSSPKKLSKAPRNFMPPMAPSSVEQPENICHYFATGDSTVGKTHIAFKPIARNCDARLLEIRYPMSGYVRRAKTAAVAAAMDHRGLPVPQAETAPVKKQICKVTLQIFRLPPLPGLTQEQLPQSIDECLRGMRHHAWHEHEYFEGVMTQRGGDCSAPRRRSFKIIGSNLVASNAVTKKTVFSIDLRKATKLIDENSESAAASLSPDDEYEHVDRMPRSFTLVFDDGERVTFWTDNDAEKAGWMDALNILIGKIPSNPLWAEMLAAKQRHNRSRSASSAKASDE